MKLLKSPRFWIGVGFVVLVIALRYSGLADSLSLSRLQEKRLELAAYVDTYYFWAVLAFIGVYIGAVILGLPLAALCTLVGGFLFGTLLGALYSVIGATIGAAIFFVIVRHSLGATLQEKYKDKLAWLNSQMERYGVSYLIAIRFVFVIPFFVLNLLIGLTNTSIWRFIWTTAVGIFPGSLVYAFAGKQLTKISSIQDVFTWPILLAFTLLGLLAVLPILAQRYGLLGSSNGS